ncbi:hypothetical protein IWW47_004182, partial [Coemansia sp. RSA 2052]
MEHGRNPSDVAPQPPAPRGAMAPSGSVQHAGHGAPPQYAQHAKVPHQAHGHMPPGRPGYPPEDHGYGRYDHMARPDHPGADGPGAHYPGGSGGPPTSTGYLATSSYQATQYSQPMSQQHTPHPYSMPGHPQGPPSYPAHGPPPSSGPYRSEDVRMASRHHSPNVPQQQQHPHHHHHQQQQQHQMHPQQSTPIVEQQQQQRPGSAFQQGPPVNGYAPYPGPSSAEARHRSRSPSRLQSPSYRQGNYGQPAQQPDAARHGSTRDDRHSDHPGDVASGTAYPSTYVRHGSVKAAGAPGTQAHVPSSAKAFRGDPRAPTGDRDGDVSMEDATPTMYKSAPSRTEAGSGASISLAAMSAAPISLPQISTPTSDIPISSTPVPSGPTAAPIRLPPVQLGGINSFSSSGNAASSSLGPISSVTQSGFAAEESSRSGANVLSAATSVDGPASLASTHSTAEDDKEDFAINSLMSLSNVATTLTTRPRVSSPPTYLGISSAEAAPSTANRPDAQPSEPAEISVTEANRIRDLEISSPRDSKPSSEPAGAASADTEDSSPLALAFSTKEAAIGSGNGASRSGASSPATSMAGGSNGESAFSNGSMLAL